MDDIGFFEKLAEVFIACVSLILFLVVFLIYKIGFHTGAKVWGIIFLSFVLYFIFGGTTNIFLQVLLIIIFPIIDISLLIFLFVRWVRGGVKKK